MECWSCEAKSTSAVHAGDWPASCIGRQHSALCAIPATHLGVTLDADNAALSRVQCRHLHAEHRRRWPAEPKGLVTAAGIDAPKGVFQAAHPDGRLDGRQGRASCQAMWEPHRQATVPATHFRSPQWIQS
jgi:hypothetical protein